ncbi:tetratricopeptide repeat protein [Flavobacterium sp. TSSA_36]|uniref:tetratricopeptide repeat protein n=1 Tax=Flavobacterium sp. TSSA_36 TaxID=3447669 RepID=UPI003F3BBC64
MVAFSLLISNSNLSNLKRFYGYVGLFLVLLLLFLGYLFYTEDSSNYEVFTAIKPSHGTYVGDSKCIDCHRATHQQWTTSHHYKSMLLPTPETVKGDFNTSTYTADGVTSHFFKKGTKFFINTEGEDGKNHDYEVKYVFGFTPLQQYLVAFPGGRMQVPRVSWDTEKKRWYHQYSGQKIASHDWLHWTGNSQNWNTMCATCHSTNLQKKYSSATDSYQTTFDVINVSCESCHGPGASHLDYIKGAAYQSGERMKGSFLKLAKNSSQKEEINTCAPCHARATEIAPTHIESTELLDNYIPQIPDKEYYFEDGQIKEEDYIYASFLQSKMYNKGVKCSDCHDVHTTQLKRQGNQTCTKCHVASQYDTRKHTFHATDGEGAKCVSCHMPGRFYMGNDYRHDHNFKAPRPDLSQRYGTPNACSNCHKNKTNAELAKTVVQWYGEKRAYHFAEDLVPGSALNEMSEPHLLRLIYGKKVPQIIKATAAFYLSSIQTPKSVAALLFCLKSQEAQVRYRSIRSLQNFPPEQWMPHVFPLLKDKVRAVRIAAADLVVSIPLATLPATFQSDFKAAQNELVQFLHYQTDFSAGNVLLADYYMKTNELEKAKIYYLKGLKKDDQMNYAWLNLSAVYNAQGNNTQALASLVKAAKNDPKNERIFYNLGLLYSEMNQPKAAVAAFDKALLLGSKNPKLYYNYSLLLLQSQKIEEAQRVISKGITITPYASELYYALAFVYMQSNAMDKAQETVSLLKKMDGNNPNYQSLFAQFRLNSIQP